MFDFTLLWSCFIIALSNLADASRILGVSCFPAVSHQGTLVPIWRELSLRGHQVTALITNPLKDKSLINLTEIDTSYTYDIVRNSDLMSHFGPGTLMYHRVMFLEGLMEKVMKAQLEDDEVRRLIADERNEFDAIIVEPHHPLAFAFGARFRAPIIAVSSLGVFLETHDSVGNPTHPLLSPSILSDAGVTFAQKMCNLLYNFWYRALYYLHILPKADAVARKYFGVNMPYLGEIVQNTSLVLTNVNPIMHTVRANVPNVIEIGQLHIERENKPLPKDLQKFLDSSVRGAVYFSLGTNVIISDVANSTIETIAAALAELPYDVVWKWDKDSIPRKPDNVMLKKWLPQQDLLGHPNMKVFITQGGIQSIEESIFKGVPMVGIPFIGDQSQNVRKLVERGMANYVDPRRITKEVLRDAVMEVATNPKYRQQVINARRLLEDQPLAGLDKAIWWIEYVIRHKGADHLKNPAARMSFYTYYMVDVVGFLIVSVTMFVYFILKIRSLVLRVTRRCKQKTD